MSTITKKMKINKNKNELMSIQKFFHNREVSLSYTSLRYTIYRIKKSIYCIEEINYLRLDEKKVKRIKGFFLHRSLKKSLKKILENLRSARNATYVFNNSHPKKRAIEKLFYSI